MAIFPGGWWYQDHCLLIKTYKSPLVRWQYPGEAWQEIEGDDYSTKTVEDLSGSKSYHLLIRQLKTTDHDSWDAERRAYPSFFNGIQSWRLVARHIRVDYYPPNNKHYDFFYDSSTGYYGSDYFIVSQGQTSLKFIARGFTSLWITGISAVNAAQRVTACAFTVTKNGQTVYTETRAVCPEIEKLPCQAQPIEKLEFQTSPLGYIATSNKSFSQDGQTTVDIPAGCVDVYNVIPSVPIGGTIRDGSSGVPIWSFKGQFCSSIGCPEPEILHLDGLCDPCQSCPSNTCAVECNGQICCYGTDGKAVKTIALNNYCGGQI